MRVLSLFAGLLVWGGTARDLPAQPLPSGPRVQPADIAFMQGMIGHHAQAVEMVALLESRTQTPALRLLGERIAVSQRDELAVMRQWLATHAPGAPAQAAGHPGHADHARMPGMLTAAQMDSLRTSTGPEFDRRFLRFMIQHHEGALVMVAELFRTPGAGQEPQLYQFATDVDADQRAEIRRMQAVLGARR